MNVYAAQWLGCRESQQDAYAVRHFPDGVLAVVCDGMGGHDGGAMASRVAADSFEDAFSSGDGRPAPERLRAALEQANSAVGAAFAECGSFGGTTLLAAWVSGGLLWWASVGDSPFLLWRAGHLIRLNEDHSLRSVYMDYVRKGIYSYEEAMAEGHALLSALTGELPGKVDIPPSPRPLLPGDRLVLATDGVDGLLLPRTLSCSTRRLLAEPGGSLAARIVEGCQALQDPEADNVTVLTLDL